MKRWLKGLILYTRQERRGILFLLLLAVGVYAAGVWWTKRLPPLYEPPPTAADSLFRHPSSGLRDRYKPSTVRRLFPFDPNQADSATLTQLGLPVWMARNVVKYRQAGGRFRRAEDFSRIYGMTTAMYLELRPYITLPDEERAASQTPARKDGVAGRPDAQGTPPPLQPAGADSIRPRWPRQEKYPVGTRISLNHSDTTELKKIPGIGSVMARRIVEYRRRLGGYYRVEQLEEIGLDVETLRPWFKVDTAAITRLAVNRLEIARLRAHPYLNFYQAKAVVEYRERHGAWSNAKPLRLLQEFSPQEAERLVPYLSFE